MFEVLSRGLLAADGFIAIAGATLASNDAFGYLSGVVEAHGAAGRPFVCVATRHFDVGSLRRYLDGNFRKDLALELVRETHQPAISSDEHGRRMLIGPLLGEGKLIGAIRLHPSPRVDPDDRQLHLVAAICAHVSVRLAQVGYSPFGRRHALLELTPRQRQVARQVVHGLSNIEIATNLAISPNAVKKHLGLALRTLDLTNRTELAALASRACAMLELEESGVLDGFVVVANG